MMKYAVIFYMFLNFTLIKAQERNYEAVVIDSKSKNTIPYAIAIIENKGFIADSNGVIRFNIPKDNKESVIKITALGYYDTLQNISNLAQSTLTFALREKVYQLQQVIIKPGELIELGNLAKKPVFNSKVFLTPGYQAAVYINNFDSITGVLKDVSVFISDEGSLQPFRLRIYSRDLDGSPGTDLLTESTIVYPKKSCNWENISLIRYTLPIPENGCFIAVECVSGTKSFDSVQIKNSISIGLGRNKQNVENWQYNLGYGWIKQSFPAEVKNPPSFMIKATILKQ